MDNILLITHLNFRYYLFAMLHKHLQNILLYLIEHYTDFKVERRFNLNGADFCFSALTNGDIDTFVEYSGTALMNFCKLPMNSNSEVVYNQVSETLLNKHNVVTSKPLGFNNTYVLSVP